MANRTQIDQPRPGSELTPDPQAADQELSPEEVQSRLQAAARILVNGAIRVVHKRKRLQRQTPGPDGSAPASPPPKPKQTRKRPATRSTAAKSAGGESGSNGLFPSQSRGVPGAIVPNSAFHSRLD